MIILFYNSSDRCRRSKTHRRTHQTESTAKCLTNQTGLWMYFLSRLILLWKEDRQRDCNSLVDIRLQKFVYMSCVVVQCGREMPIIVRRLQAADLSETSAPQHCTTCRTQRHIDSSEQLQYTVTAVCER